MFYTLFYRLSREIASNHPKYKYCVLCKKKKNAFKGTLEIPGTLGHS